MTAVVEWFCDFCNPSRQRRNPGDEVSSGYMVTPLDTTPPVGWHDVPKGDPMLPTGGHACMGCRNSIHWMKCRLHEEGMQGATEEELRTGEGPGVSAAADERRPAAWPAHASPFGTQGG